MRQSWIFFSLISLPLACFSACRDEGDGPADGRALAVAFTAPADGSRVGGVVPLAVDVKGGKAPVAVRFSLGDDVLATVSEPPYLVAWRTDDWLGDQFTVTALASDADGSTAQASIDLQIDGEINAGNAPPSARITYPSNGATVCGTLELQVAATDDAKVSRVEFFVDGALVSSDDASPFGFPWNTQTAPAGSHILKIVAHDEGGQIATNAITVTVQAVAGGCDNRPAVVFLEPEADGAVTAKVRVRVSASDDVGVVGVQFFVDGGLAADLKEGPYAFDWETDAIDEGVHLLRAVATDTNGQSTQSDISVSVDRSLPRVRIVTPDEGAHLMGTISVSVEASDETGLQAVRLGTVRDGKLIQKIGAFSAAPFTFSWDTKEIPGGEVELLAEARDRVGQVASHAILVVVGNKDGAACTDEAECASGACVDGVCCEDSCQGDCRSCALPGNLGTCMPVAGGPDPGTCEGTRSCDAEGVCKLQVAERCQGNDQCLSGFCVDGVCCSTACNETCRSCGQPEMLGTCTPVVLRPDPDTCTFTSSCSTAGECKLRQGVSCTQGGECASGFCADGVCCDAACEGTCMACNRLGVCSFVAAHATDPPTCEAPMACNGLGGCKLKTGDACQEGGQCASGFCADGVCCATSCDQPCRTCAKAGSVGACTTVFSADDAECNGSCSYYGACLGKLGATCTLSSQCASGRCVDGVCCETTCGTCQACNAAGKEGACTPVLSAPDADTCSSARACDASGACKSVAGIRCTDASQCVSGFCVDGSCCPGACDGSCQECSTGVCKGVTGKQDGPLCADTRTCNDEGQCERLPPQPLQPVNGALTGSVFSSLAKRPRFMWRAVPDATGYHLQVDDDRTFASPELDLSSLTGTSHRAGADLPVSTVAPVGRRYYWRVRGCWSQSECTGWSAIRYVDVGRQLNDYNGDGYGDFVIGYPDDDEAGTNAGKVNIHFGKASLSTTPDRTIKGAGAGVKLGNAGPAGDVNGDGYPDLLLAAPYTSTTYGTAYLYLGGPDFPATPITFSGRYNSYYGSELHTVGDLNNDGYADFAIAAQYEGSYTGRVDIFLGGATIDKVADWSRFGLGYNDLYGSRVLSAGDVNGDGYGDFVVTASEAINTGAYTGYFQVFLGGAGPLSTAPFVSRFGDAAAREWLGAGATAADFNDDGYTDVAVSAPHAQVGWLGRVYVFNGGPAMDNQVDLQFDGPAEQGGLGGFALTATDVNGDGHPDLGIPVHGTKNAENVQIGSCLVALGGPAFDNVSDYTILGTGSSFLSLVSHGDLNGDGFADLLGGTWMGNGRVDVYLGGNPMETTSDLTFTDTTDRGSGGALARETTPASRLRMPRVPYAKQYAKVDRGGSAREKSTRFATRR